MSPLKSNKSKKVHSPGDMSRAAIDRARFAPKKVAWKIIKALPSDTKPEWDVELHELRFGGVIVKRFTGRAGPQRLILAVFQELGWPRKIDDPLPPGKLSQLPAERLRDVVRRLNTDMVNSCIRFHCTDASQSIE
jgi:hypothetical protein